MDQKPFDLDDIKFAPDFVNHRQLDEEQFRPITVWDTGENKYQIISGHRRASVTETPILIVILDSHDCIVAYVKKHWHAKVLKWLLDRWTNKKHTIY